ncbi:MAG: hypothetical protein ACK5HL_02405 [Bacilli bacterium]
MKIISLIICGIIIENIIFLKLLNINLKNKKSMFKENILFIILIIPLSILGSIKLFYLQEFASSILISLVLFIVITILIKIFYTFIKKEKLLPKKHLPFIIIIINVLIIVNITSILDYTNLLKIIIYSSIVSITYVFLEGFIFTIYNNFKFKDIKNHLKIITIILVITMLISLLKF